MNLTVRESLFQCRIIGNQLELFSLTIIIPQSHLLLLQSKVTWES